jgi:hypothetical protein
MKYKESLILSIHPDGNREFWENTQEPKRKTDNEI